MDRPRHSKPIVFDSPSRDRRTVFSPRLQRLVTLYSALEFAHYVDIESNPEVDVFCEQPVRAEVRIEGKDYATVLDMWVRFRNGYEEYREVKPAAKVASGEYAQQLRTGAMWCQGQGRPHRIITENDLTLRPQELENWEQILGYLSNTGWVTRQGIDGSLARYFAKHAVTTLLEVERDFPAVPPTELHRAVFLLLHRAQISADLASASLSRRTQFQSKV